MPFHALLRKLYHWNEMFIIWLSVINHLFLHTRRNIIGIALSAFNRSSWSESHKTSNSCVGWNNRTVLNYATVFKNTPSALNQSINKTDSSFTSDNTTDNTTYNHNVSTNMYIRANRSGLNNGLFPNENMITNIQWKEGNSKLGSINE